MKSMLNQLHLLDNQKGIAKLADKSVNLIIADPPYYKIKGDFDFEFKDFQEYLNFMEEQAKLYKRVLADNGSLFVYGHAKNIAYVQVIFDKYFNLENNITIHIVDRQTNKGVESFNCFAPVTERVLFYSSINQSDIFDYALYDAQNYIKDLIYKYGGNVTTANEFYKKYSGLNGNYRSIFFGKSEYCFYTEQQYNGLCEYIKSLNCKEDIISYEYFKDLFLIKKQLYELERRPFNNKKKLTDVMRYSQESHITRQFDHDTIKPEKLTLDLIETTTKENDIVLIPFAGSGTECVCSMRLKRQWVAFENKKKYFDIALKRIQSEYEKTSLFNSLGGRQLQLSA